MIDQQNQNQDMSINNFIKVTKKNNFLMLVIQMMKNYPYKLKQYDIIILL